MTTVLLFHHAQGQTVGFLDFAERLREAGHTVHAPDLFDGRTFETVEEGVSHAREVGFDRILQRGIATAEDLPPDVVYSGFSLGGMPAQALAQTRPGARGAILYHACLPPSEFGGPWPAGVPLEIHFMEDDPWAEEDLPAAKKLAEEVDRVELFLYPGSGHLFADASSDDYDEDAARLLMERTLAFLDRVGRLPRTTPRSS
ncbi:MAG: dienelactone hydrolase family protein [Planctomycetaceae bacterium]